MRYCYSDETGQTIERDYRIGRAPDVVVVDGVTFRRDLRAEGAKAGHADIRPYVSNQIPAKYPGFKHDPGTGKCVVESRQQLRQYMRKNGLEYL